MRRSAPLLFLATLLLLAAPAAAKQPPTYNVTVIVAVNSTRLSASSTVAAKPPVSGGYYVIIDSHSAANLVAYALANATASAIATPITGVIGYAVGGRRAYAVATLYSTYDSLTSLLPRIVVAYGGNVSVEEAVVGTASLPGGGTLSLPCTANVTLAYSLSGLLELMTVNATCVANATVVGVYVRAVRLYGDVEPSSILASKRYADYTATSAAAGAASQATRSAAAMVSYALLAVAGAAATGYWVYEWARSSGLSNATLAAVAVASAILLLAALLIPTLA